MLTNFLYDVDTKFLTYFRRVSFLNIKQSRQCTYKYIMEVLSFNHCWHGKAIIIIYPECLCATLVIQHANA